MKYIKKYGIQLLSTLLYIIISLFVFTILYYYNLINDNIYNFIKLLILLISIFINSLILGKKSNNIKDGIIFIILLISLSFILSIFNNEFKIRNILFYIIISSTSFIGTKLGLKRKKKV